MLPFFQHSSGCRFVASVFIIVAILSSCPSKIGYCEKMFFNDHRPMVVIDPGHGGAETGVAGPSGLNEKDITLTMAHTLKRFLKEKYFVRLTRTGDYYVNSYERGAFANKEKGDLFVSLHIGSCPRGSNQDVTLFLYARQSVVIDIDDENTTANDNLWSHIQLRHKAAGKKAALMAKQAFAESIERLSTEIQYAPIAVLKGTDMPSFLVEIGCLSSYSGEKELMDNNFISKYMSALADGIDRFLNMKNKNP